jgi:hypothetical protein
MNHYIHHVPGRLRIKNPLFKNDVHKLSEAQKCFDNIHGIHKVKGNALTGSIVVLYDPERIKPDYLMQIFKDCEYVDENRAVNLDYTLTHGLNKAGMHIGKACLSFFVQETLKDSSLGLLFAFI